MKAMLLAAGLSASVIFLSASCRPSGQTSGPGDLSTSDSSSFLESQPGNTYWHLTGTIGNLRVTMELFRRTYNYPTGTQEYYDGYYHYDRLQEPIPMYGSLDSTGQIVLTENLGMGSTTGVFTGTWTTDGVLEGTWSTESGDRSLPFQLREDYSQGTVALKLYFLEDSTALRADLPDSPRATISQSWLLPGQMEDLALKSFLEEEIRKGMLGDSLARLYPNPKAGFDAEKEQYFNDYRFMSSDYNPAEDESFIYTYNQSRSMEVVFNGKGLLTVGFTDYSYTGGAHGNYGTAYASYDLQNRKILPLSDIFQPGYEEKLGAMLEQSARTRYQIPAGDPLSSFFFEDTIAPNDNFGLTGKGIFFNYVPYEIAAYAVGEVKLFIPFESVKDLLQPAFAQQFVR